MLRPLRIVLALLLLSATAVFLIRATLPLTAPRLPGVVQQRLPSEVWALVRTPLPTALPAPEVMPIAPITTAVSLIPTDTPTNSPSAEPEVETAVFTPSPTPTPTATPSPTPPPPSAERLEGVAIVPQKFNNCGAANLSIVLNYFGHDADQLAIAAVVRPTYEDRNVSPHELQAYVNEQTPLRAALVYAADMTLLKQLVSAGYPVIIEAGLIPSEWEGWMGHYLTITGYTDKTQTFIGMDTFLGPWDSSGRAEDYGELAELWHQFNNTLLVVYPPEREEAVMAILGGAHTEPLQMWRRSAEKAQTAVTATPTDAFAWFNLGSSLTQLGRLTGEQVYYENAVAAFDQARTIGLPWRMLWYQFDLYEAYLANGRYQDVLTLTEAMLNSGGQFVEETFLYQGHAWLALGDESRARAAYEQAVALQPNSQTATEALSLLK